MTVLERGEWCPECEAKQTKTVKYMGLFSAVRCCHRAPGEQEAWCHVLFKHRLRAVSNPLGRKSHTIAPPPPEVPVGLNKNCRDLSCRILFYFLKCRHQDSWSGQRAGSGSGAAHAESLPSVPGSVLPASPGPHTSFLAGGGDRLVCLLLPSIPDSFGAATQGAVSRDHFKPRALLRLTV